MAQSHIHTEAQSHTLTHFMYTYTLHVLFKRSTVTGIKEFLIYLFVLQTGHLRSNRHQLKLKTPHNWYNVTGFVPYSFHFIMKKEGVQIHTSLRLIPKKWGNCDLIDWNFHNHAGLQHWLTETVTITESNSSCQFLANYYLTRPYVNWTTAVNVW